MYQSGTFNASPTKIALFMLVAFSGYYLAGIGITSPVYFTFILSFLISTVFVRWATFSFDRILIVPVFYTLYVVVTQPFLSPDASSFTGILFSMVVLFLTVFLLGRVDRRADLIYYSEVYLKYSTFILVIESLWRVTHPLRIVNPLGADVTEEVLWFYPYKMSSIMFQDSNFVGLFIVVALFFSFYLSKQTGRKYRFLKWVLLVLLVLTFSRSAWIATLFSWLVLRYVKSVSIRAIVGIALMGVIALVTLILVGEDESYLSKFMIIEVASDVISDMSLRSLVFGLGFGNTAEAMYTGAHNIFLTYLLEGGIVGLVLCVSMYYSFYRLTKPDGKYIILPYLISALSAFGHGNPYFLVPLCLIYFLQKEKFSGDVLQPH